MESFCLKTQLNARSDVQVWRCEDVNGGSQIAKLFPKSALGEKAFLKERSIYQIAQVDFDYTILETETHHVIFMDDLGQSLFDLIDNDTKFSAKWIQNFAYQLFTAVLNLHSKGICHGDIKPENIVVNSAGKVFLIDYGLSEVIGVNGRSRSVIGSTNYCPPEALRSRFHTLAADIWALGVTLYVLCAKALPFDSSDEYHTLCSTLRDAPKLDSIRKGHGDVLADLMTGMLDKNPSRRPTIGDCLKSTWLNTASEDTKIDLHLLHSAGC
jgi:serine/threonine protein kinase